MIFDSLGEYLFVVTCGRPAFIVTTSHNCFCLLVPSRAGAYRDVFSFTPEVVLKVAEINMDYDPEKTLRIVSNLLSNAIKYAPERGQVVFQASSGKKSELPTE